MNERIRKLMDGCFDITVDSRGREECCADYINVQKFAELVVMECINCYSPDDSADDWADKMRKLIEP
jgi:hypothetical protein